jgi:hypothetical protein
MSADKWPALGDRLFADGPMQIDLSWLSAFDSEKNYIGGFKQAAGTVCDRLLKDTHPFEMGEQFIALAYLYRHCIELQLKYIIDMAIRLNAYSEKMPFTHELLKLWTIVRQLLEQQEPTADRTPLEVVEGLINELHAVDPGGEDFRFAVRRDKNLSMTKVPSSFSLIVFSESMNKLYQFFDGCMMQFDAWWDSVNYVDY